MYLLSHIISEVLKKTKIIIRNDSVDKNKIDEKKKSCITVYAK